jgi:acetate kinase
MQRLVLVLNVGSSSLKAALLEAESTQAMPLWQIGADREGPLQEQLNGWLAPRLSERWPQISAAGHRLVHGGERFTAPTRLEPAVLEELASLSDLAPLHNPPALEAIEWLRRQRPQLLQWACFDTAFHANLPPEASTYALPAAWRAGGQRRYGFHGLNHQHVSEVALQHWQAAGRSGKPRLISAHLGAGCSLAAVRNGRSIDTTMGFTPLEGLVMASRSGSVDPGLLLHLLRNGTSLEQLEDGLNRRSGLLGLSGLSGDWRELRAAAADEHAGAQLALAVFLHRLKQEIGAMAASLGGVDQIALSGGVGANDSQLLQELQELLRWLGPVHWLQIPADEEGMIARLVCRVSDRADQASGAAGG